MLTRRNVTFRLPLVAVFLACVLLVLFSISTPAVASPEPPLFACQHQRIPPAGPPPPTAPVVRITPPTVPLEDANWPIVSRKTWKEIDASGIEHTITEISKRNPAAQKNVGLSLPGLTTDYCSFASQGSTLQSDCVGVSTICQYTWQLWNKYRFQNGSIGPFSAYLVRYTVEWWHRDFPSLTVGQNATNWDWRGFKCDNSFELHQATGGFTPAWYDDYVTYNYQYDFTVYWPVETPGPDSTWYWLRTTETSPWYNYGNFLANTNTTIRLSPAYP